MVIELGEQLTRQLEVIARQRQRDLSELVQEAVEQYLARQAEMERFEATIERIMDEHDWLLSELAKQ